MIITVDGLEGSGKSTLARQLAQELDFKYIRKPIYEMFDVQPEDTAMEEILFDVMDKVYNQTNSDKLKTWFTGLPLLYLKEVMNNENLVVDRGLLTAYAYNGNESSDAVFRTLLDFGVGFDLNILLYVSDEVKRERMMKRNPNDYRLKLDKIMDLKYDNMENFVRGSGTSTILINTDNKTEGQVLNETISQIKATSYREHPAVKKLKMR